MNIEKVVQRQLDGYNNRDMALYLSAFSPTIKIFNFQESTPVMSGLKDLEAIYKDIFDNSPNLNATIVNRMIFDNKVIDHEHVSGRKGIPFTEIIAIYEIENELIEKVTFIRKT